MVICRNYPIPQPVTTYLIFPDYVCFVPDVLCFLWTLMIMYFIRYKAAKLKEDIKSSLKKGSLLALIMNIEE